MKRSIVILGSTGSIGRNAVWVARNLGSDLHVAGIAACRNLRLLAEQAAELRCEWVAVTESKSARELRELVPVGCRVVSGEAGMIDMVTAPSVDIVLCAIVGTAGLKPVLAAIRAGKTIALASKEILVAAGELVMAEAKRCGVRILPVDSEHSAVFQCLEGQRREHLRRIYLTASGGPFRTTPAAQMAELSCAEALAHPTWNMGTKVTIDSATLMNKGLELIEAHWLFDARPDMLEVVIHPQSIIHSMVEFVDGSVLAQLSRPDMRLPIQYALTWPERRALGLEPLDWRQVRKLEFEPPDLARFPCLALARQALATGGTSGAVLNAANEVAVARFMKGEISFVAIPQVVERVSEQHTLILHPSIETILEADQWARRTAQEALPASSRR